MFKYSKLPKYSDNSKFENFWWTFYAVLVAWEDGLIVDKKEVSLDG
jgi:hypothetical protein